MKKLLGLLVILIIGFTSCEGRKTQGQALSEDIEDFKNEVKIEKVIYKPANYVEREVDTLLYNGYRVKIKTYSDMDNTVLFTEIKGTVNYQTYYRNFKFDILVEKDGKRIYNEHFDKNKINTLLEFNSATEPNNKDFDKLGILKSIEIDDNLSFPDRIKIDIMYAVPETDRTSLYSLFINKKGIVNVDRIENN
ncbi:hypothetical protein [uncultured Winogradskyella sp.]|uniref:hypothetical protein n=1 Tax=uncultured Winogradskyella sp. TaxID=395353 RepID=UPI002639A194|nr:hypothetical protein [uncultured Winogradskyella sp.]